MFIFSIFMICKTFFMCIISIYYMKKSPGVSWCVLGVSSGGLGRPGVIRLTG